MLFRCNANYLQLRRKDVRFHRFNVETAPIFSSLCFLYVRKSVHITIRDRKCGLRMIIHWLCKDHEEDRVSFSFFLSLFRDHRTARFVYIPIGKKFALVSIWNCRFYFIIMISLLITFQTNAFTSKLWYNFCVKCFALSKISISSYKYYCA